mgnify:CR=1 FL=1
MNQPLRNDADKIISASLKAVLPDSAVQRALSTPGICPITWSYLVTTTPPSTWPSACTAAGGHR